MEPHWEAKFPHTSSSLLCQIFRLPCHQPLQHTQTTETRGKQSPLPLSLTRRWKMQENHVHFYRYDLICSWERVCLCILGPCLLIPLIPQTMPDRQKFAEYDWFLEMPENRLFFQSILAIKLLLISLFSTMTKTYQGCWNCNRSYNLLCLPSILKVPRRFWL